jgi:hypothetical protein
MTLSSLGAMQRTRFFVFIAKHTPYAKDPPTMRLAEQLRDYVNAAFTGLWIHTQEPDEAEREILEHSRPEGWTIAIWDIARGLHVLGTAEAPPAETTGGDPLAALRALRSLAQPSGTTLLVLHNFHRFLNSPEIVQTAFTELVSGKERRTFIVVLSPAVQITLELEKILRRAGTRVARSGTVRTDCHGTRRRQSQRPADRRRF